MTLCSFRSRLGQLNCPRRTSKYVGVVRRWLEVQGGGEQGEVVVLGEQGVLGLIAAKLGCKKVS